MGFHEVDSGDTALDEVPNGAKFFRYNAVTVPCQRWKYGLISNLKKGN